MVQFIIYVSNQQRSKDFYRKVLDLEPSLNVSGMTEFTLSENCKLGIMPEAGIAKILEGKTPHPADGNGIPRCELYIHVNNVEEYYIRAIKESAKEISAPTVREWGDNVGYVSDPDGHIIAFAGI